MHEVVRPGVLVLCSDGLWNYFSRPEQLADLLAAAEDGALDGARRLVRAALDAGGGDNVAVAVVPVGPQENPLHVGGGTDDDDRRVAT
jgi:serine/threonine protein phosphatase PrpC